MRALIAREESGRVRDAFIRRGVDAVSLDVLPTSSPGPHRQEPLTAAVLAEGWDLVVSFPPCTDLSNIGAASWPQKQADGRQQAAFEFVRMIWDAPVERVSIENPTGWLNSHWRKPTQIINPWQFGDPYTKRTCLWLRGLPALTPLVTVKPEGVTAWVTGQTMASPDGRQYVPGDLTRRTTNKAFLRAKTFPGIADAMAREWAR